MGLIQIFGEDNLRYLLLWVIFYGLYNYFFHITLLSLISFFMLGLIIIKAIFICIFAFVSPNHNNPIHKAEDRALAHDGIVDTVYSLINGSFNRFAQMIRNTSVFQLILVGLTLFGLKTLFKITIVLGLLAQGLFKIFGPTITRLNNWFDSGRQNISHRD